MADTSIALMACAFPSMSAFDIVLTSVAVDAGSHGDLAAVELQSITGASPRRLREFAAGRSAARKAMALVGSSEIVVPRATERFPLWPEGITGSISHSRHLAVAAVSRDRRVLGIGLDVEDMPAHRGHNFASQILTADECSSMDAFGLRDPGAVVALVASCKEAAYKAVYPICGEYFEFPDIEIRFDHGARTFRVAPAPGLASAGLLQRGLGSFAIRDGHVLSIFVIEQTAG